MKELKSIEERLAQLVTEIRPIEIEGFRETMGKGDPTPETLEVHVYAALVREAREHIENAYRALHRVTF